MKKFIIPLLSVLLITLLLVSACAETQRVGENFLFDAPAGWTCAEGDREEEAEEEAYDTLLASAEDGTVVCLLTPRSAAVCGSETEKLAAMRQSLLADDPGMQVTAEENENGFLYFTATSSEGQPLLVAVSEENGLPVILTALVSGEYDLTPLLGLLAPLNTIQGCYDAVIGDYSFSLILTEEGHGTLFMYGTSSSFDYLLENGIPVMDGDGDRFDVTEDGLCLLVPGGKPLYFTKRADIEGADWFVGEWHICAASGDGQDIPLDDSIIFTFLVSKSGAMDLHISSGSTEECAAVSWGYEDGTIRMYAVDGEDIPLSFSEDRSTFLFDAQGSSLTFRKAE